MSIVKHNVIVNDDLRSVWHITKQELKTRHLFRKCIKESVDNTLFYPETEEIYPQIKEKKTNKLPKNVFVSNLDTMAAAIRMRRKSDKKIGVLNFANTYHPGGAVAKGVKAQEENLCRVSTLYPVLNTTENKRRFYGKHMRNRKKFGTSDILYCPNIVVFRLSDAGYAFMMPEEYIEVDVITCAAPELKKPLDDKRIDYGIERQRLYFIHLERGKRIIESAIKNEVRLLVLGAFGCGKFHNDPQIVAGAYRKLMTSYAHYFDIIEFAVYSTEDDERNYRVFREVFS